MITAPRVLTLIGSLDGSSMWRAIQPSEELQRQGFVCHWDYNSADGLASATARYGYDAIVLERLSWTPGQMGDARQFIDAFHRAGKAVFFACDDDAWLAIDEHLTEEIDRERLERNKLSLYTMRLTDGVVVSTQRLATIVRTLTDKPVAVVPNLIDLAWFRAVQAQAVRVVRGLTIGWYGTKRQDSDLEPLGRAWERIAARFPRVKFVIAGHVSPVVAGRVPAERLTVIPYLPLDSYPLGLVNIDIGCCSVADNRFNRAKSIIKALEYGARGRTAVVATPTLYREIVRPNDTGYLAETADEWEAALSRLIEDAALRRALARRLGREVERGYSLQAHATRWLGAWQYLLSEWKANQKRGVQLWTPHQRSA
jgi:glycosyltransferase involved in cell wall biosynthesis